MKALEVFGALKGDIDSVATGFKSAKSNDDGSITVTFVDDSTVTTFPIKGDKGEKGDKGNNGTNGKNGIDGVSVVGTEQIDVTHFRLLLSDGSKTDIITMPQGTGYDDTEIRQEIAETKAIAKGRATGYVFDTVSDMNTWVSSHKDILVLGDNLYIRATDVPDYWWDGNSAQQLETQKVDLTDYATKEYVDIHSGGETNYTEEEQIIGTWFGKPLYRKVIRGITMPSTTADGTPSFEYIPIANLDVAINCRGYFVNSAGNCFMLNSNQDQNKAISRVYSVGKNAVANPSSVAILNSFKNWNGLECTVIVEYTKTTD